MSTGICICPCDCDLPEPPNNPPGLSTLAYRVGGYAQFRRALLTPRPGETELSAWTAASDAPAALLWRPGAQGDLAVMMVEWWAYLADILAFYNERIANQQYLGTADQDASVRRLIRLLGYRPTPGLAARAVLGALVLPGQSAVLPRGLQFQNKPGPGQEVQTFELDADTAIGFPDVTPARPPEQLLAPDASSLLLQGSVSSIPSGALLLLHPRDGRPPGLVQVSASSVESLEDRSKQTRLSVTVSAPPPAGLTAAASRLERAGQTSGLWSFHPSFAIEKEWELIGGSPWELFIQVQRVHLAGLARDLRAGDWVVLAAPGKAPLLSSVVSTAEVIWYANGSDPWTPPAAPSKALPIGLPHTRLTLSTTLDDGWVSAATDVTVRFGWSEAAKLKDQPVMTWTGSPPELAAIAPAMFPKGSDLKLLIGDALGGGIAASGASAGDGTLTLGALDSAMAPLKPPFSVYADLLPVSRGKTVAKEVLGGGDATSSGQTFTLGKSPVTYLRSGAGYVSTVAITVDGRPWKEVASFYGQPAGAAIFVTREDEAGKTVVSFGDGVNGARLPTGVNNVVASYRVGSGAAAPPAGKLTVLAQPFPGLKGVRNPVAAAGGADPDPADQIRRYAPRSVLTFQRAVSAADFEAIAAQTAGDARVRAVWAWDDARQRAAVTIYVGGDTSVVDTVRDVLAAAGDPNRPVSVRQASAIPVTLALTLQITAGMDADVIKAAVTQALVGEDGLFSARRLGIGQSVFDSQIAQACLAVDGVEAILAQTFSREFRFWIWVFFLPDPGPLHATRADGGYFDLEAAGLTLTEVTADV